MKPKSKIKRKVYLVDWKELLPEDVEKAFGRIN